MCIRARIPTQEAVWEWASTRPFEQVWREADPMEAADRIIIDVAICLEH